MTHQNSQARHDRCAAIVQLASTDGAGQRGLIGKAEAVERLDDLDDRVVEEFVLHDAQDVGGDAGMKTHLSVAGDADVVVEEVGDGGDEFGRRRPSGQ